MTDYLDFAPGVTERSQIKAFIPVGLLDRFKVAGVVATWWDEVKYELRTLSESDFGGLVDSWVDTILFWCGAYSSVVVLLLVKTSSRRFLILLTTSTALWLSLLSGNLRGFPNRLKLVTYFRHPALLGYCWRMGGQTPQGMGETAPSGIEAIATAKAVMA
jgi:hypothetical protein